jgi:hypothetical protein
MVRLSDASAGEKLPSDVNVSGWPTGSSLRHRQICASTASREKLRNRPSADMLPGVSTVSLVVNGTDCPERISASHRSAWPLRLD